MESNQQSSDHDLLTNLIATNELNFRQIREDIKDLKEGTTDRLKSLEVKKANREEVQMLQDGLNRIQKHINEDIEHRLRGVENKASTFLLTTTIYSVFIASMIGLIIYHILQS